MRTIVFLFFLFFNSQYALSQRGYTAFIKIVKDSSLFKISLISPKITDDSVQFALPKSVPGVFTIINISGSISDFKAVDKHGGNIKSKLSDLNTYTIYNSKDLDKIEYCVKDLWLNKKFLSKAAGSIVRDDYYLLNFNTIIGCIVGKENVPVNVFVTKPSDFYAATSINTTKSNDSTDLIQTPNYSTLIDNPILYCKPDTISFKINKTTLSISVYSENNYITSKLLMDYIKPIVEKSYKYYENYIDSNYSLIYIFNNSSKDYGAHEHKNSSVYIFSQEGDINSIIKEVQIVTIHELFHLITPLSLKDNVIEKFNLFYPEMSMHLWFYEGCIDYLSLKFSLVNSIINQEEFYERIGTRVYRSKGLSLQPDYTLITKMSKNIYSSNSSFIRDIYDKGVLIAFLLDIDLFEKTQQKKSLIKIISYLASKYVKQPFNENDLFSEFSVFSPDLDVFFSKYLINNEPLPMENLSKLGYILTDKMDDKATAFFETKYELYHYSSIDSTALIGNNGTLKLISKINGLSVSKELLNQYLLHPKSNKAFTVTIKTRDKYIDISITPSYKINGHNYYRIEKIININQTTFNELFFKEL